MHEKTRIEKDVLGELEVPENAYWGINTQRALKNFQISGKKFPTCFIIALAQVKKACLLSNLELKNIGPDIADALNRATDEIIDKRLFLDQFPLDIYQAGSGTQTNMNMNEVLANRANEILGKPKGQKLPVHPNDHVNKGQSSNDVIPTTMHLVTIKELDDMLLPAIEIILQTLDKKIANFKDIIKVGRTHLQDAVPIPLSMEFSVYREQILRSKNNLSNVREELMKVPLGGTAVGTGINTHREFSQKATTKLSEITGINIIASLIKASDISSHNIFVRVSSYLKTLALALMKLANDIRWMGSGPRAGLGELILPENEPGSSIMPGKINPTQSEMLIQVCLQVIGNDTTVTFAEGYGSILDLNVTKPVIIYNILDSLHLLANGIKSFNDNCLADLKANKEHIKKQLERNLMVVTKITEIIGYDQASEVAKYAYENGISIKEALTELGIIIDAIDVLLDPKNLVF